MNDRQRAILEGWLSMIDSQTEHRRTHPVEAEAVRQAVAEELTAAASGSLTESALEPRD